jgi:hypothetical protein
VIKDESTAPRNFDELGCCHVFIPTTAKAMWLLGPRGFFSMLGVTVRLTLRIAPRFLMLENFLMAVVVAPC